jgi:hypothetical protein
MRLLHWTQVSRLPVATCLTGTNVMTISATMCEPYIGKLCTIARLIEIDPITDACSEFDWVSQDAGDRPRCNIDCIIIESAPVGKAGIISHKKSESLPAIERCRGNSGIQAQQVRDWSGVVRSASWANRRHVLN